MTVSMKKVAKIVLLIIIAKAASIAITTVIVAMAITLAIITATPIITRDLHDKKFWVRFH